MLFIVTSKKRLLIYFCIVATAIVVGTTAYKARENFIEANGNSAPTYLAIIIDDFGNNAEGTKEMMSLSIPYTAAIMPSMRYTKEEEQQLHQLGKDIILHMPMEPLNGKKSWLGPNALTTDLSDAQIDTNLSDSFAQLQYCVGMNNHMGSKAMENERILTHIFNFVATKQILFVDSKTSTKPTARKLAAEAPISFLERNVFLDGTKDVHTIEKNILKAADYAVKNGSCIAIGHVGIEGGTATVQALKNTAPALAEKGVQCVTISQLNEILHKKAVSSS